MKYRECTIFTGARFSVPENIQRIESPGSERHSATYGWQVRYGEGDPFFSDGSDDGSGAGSALAAATRELIWRIHTQLAPVRLRQRAGRTKKNELPPGISGPVQRRRLGRNIVEYNYLVVIPRYGAKPTSQKVYIGTQNTVDDARRAEALRWAMEIRERAVESYQRAATEARRARTPPPG